MKRLCTNCKGENEYIISETSSSYVYCEDCGNMKQIALKQDMFDSILKSMDTYFKHTKVKSIYDLDGFLVEEINVNILKKKPCPFTLSKKDEYFFKNTVDYLIEDDLHISSSEIELHIEFIN
mgnify:CR=1 FL=1